MWCRVESKAEKILDWGSVRRGTIAVVGRRYNMGELGVGIERFASCGVYKAIRKTWEDGMDMLGRGSEG